MCRSVFRYFRRKKAEWVATAGFVCIRRKHHVACVQRCSSPSSELARKASCVVQTGAVCMFETGVLGRVSGLYSLRSAYVHSRCVSWDTTNRRRVVWLHLFFHPTGACGFEFGLAAKQLQRRCYGATHVVYQPVLFTGVYARVFQYRLYVMTKFLNLVAAVLRSRENKKKLTCSGGARRALVCPPNSSQRYRLHSS